MKPFADYVKAFNTLYGLPVCDTPTIPWIGDEKESQRQKTINRLKGFKKTLQDEVNEVDEIIAKVEAGDHPLDVLTHLADWLGDIQVYCASEMIKYGLTNDVILSLIMQSNMSKLGEDGKPIFNEDGKVMKGPGYWAPEPMIRRYIEAEVRIAMKAAGSK